MAFRIAKAYNACLLAPACLNRNIRVFVTVLVGVLVFAGGLASYNFIFPSHNNGQSDLVALNGYATLKAYHSDGTLFYTWEGHNSLTQNGVNAIVQCLSGESSTPNFWTSCSGFVSQVFVNDASFTEFKGAASNSLLPSGCNPTGNPGTCNGWKSQAIINFTSGTFPDTMNRAGTIGSGGAAFDLIGISPLTVNMGDVLVVSISFTIT